jgi:hypothetical protein
VIGPPDVPATALGKDASVKIASPIVWPARA